jgi:hypothetical protein
LLQQNIFHQYSLIFFKCIQFQADPKGSGSIGALDAANFLKKSGLKDTVLSQVS